MRWSKPFAALIGAALLLTPATAWAMPAATPPDSLEWRISDEQPDNEGSLRESRLALHQGLALGTLAGLATTAVLGQTLTYQKLHSPDPMPWQVAHVTSAIVTSLLYAGAATAALTAPPPPIPAPPAEGFDPLVWHRGMSWLHGVGLGSTVGLGLVTMLSDPSLKGVHQVLGWTTTGLMAISGGLIVFNF